MIDVASRTDTARTHTHIHNGWVGIRDRAAHLTRGHHSGLHLYPLPAAAPAVDGAVGSWLFAVGWHWHICVYAYEYMCRSVCWWPHFYPSRLPTAQPDSTAVEA